MKALPSLCIIGGGAAGVIALRIALRSKRYSRIVICEKSASGLGPGLWDYDGRSHDTPLYRDLRTNLPAMCMAIPGYPFQTVSTRSGKSDGHCDSVWGSDFPHHRQVKHYLQNFVRDQLGDLENNEIVEVRAGREVKWVEPSTPCPTPESGASTLPSTTKEQGGGYLVDGEHFDEVLVCNGHFAEPYVPAEFATLLSSAHVRHAKGFAAAEEFARRGAKTVVVVGVGPSGRDIVELLRGEVEEVCWVGSKLQDPQFLPGYTEPFRSEGKAGGRLATVVRRYARMAVEGAGEGGRVRVALTACQGGGGGAAGGAQRRELTVGEEEGVEVVLATGYEYRYDILEQSLWPGAAASGHALQSEALERCLFRGRGLGYLGLPQQSVPMLVIYYQALAFVYRARGATEGRAAEGGSAYNYNKMGAGMFGYCRELVERCVAWEEVECAAGLQWEARLLEEEHAVVRRERGREVEAEEGFRRVGREEVAELERRGASGVEWLQRLREGARGRGGGGGGGAGGGGEEAAEESVEEKGGDGEGVGAWGGDWAGWARGVFEADVQVRRGAYAVTGAFRGSPAYRDQLHLVRLDNRTWGVVL